MSGLQHPAVETAERLSEGESADALFPTLTRAGLKYVVAEVAGDDLDWDRDEIASEVTDENGSASVTKEELRALAQYVAEAEAPAGGEN